MVTASSSRESQSTVMQYGVPVASWRRYRFPMAAASSKSTFQYWRSSAARSRALGDRSALRDNGSTAALNGDSRGSSRSTVRVSTPPLVLGASSSAYASVMNAINDLFTPADGSIT